MKSKEKLSVETQMIVLNFIGNVPTKGPAGSMSNLSSPGSLGSEAQCDSVEVPDCSPQDHFTDESLLKLKLNQRPSYLQLQYSVDLPDHTSPSETSTVHSNTSRTSILELNVNEVDELVQSSSLPWFSSPLHQQLKHIQAKLEQDEKLIKGEKRFRKNDRMPSLSPKRKMSRKLSLEIESPEAEVARALAAIGDEIMIEYGDQIEAVLDDILKKEKESITYNVFKTYVSSLLSSCVTFSNLRKATLILLLSQHLAFRLIQKGEKNLNDLIQFTATLLLDYTRDYLEKLGNSWQATIVEENENYLSEPGSGNTIKSRKSSTGFFPFNNEVDEVDLSYTLGVTNSFRSRISSEKQSEYEEDSFDGQDTTSRRWRKWIFWTGICATGAFLAGLLIHRRR